MASSNFSIVRISDGVPGYQRDLSGPEKAWLERVQDKKLAWDCDCIAEEVAECFASPKENAGITSKGVKDLLDYHFGNVTDYIAAAKHVLAELLVLAGIDHHDFMDVLCKRYQINYSQASTLASRLHQENWTCHGSSMRGSMLTERGTNYLTELGRGLAWRQALQAESQT